MTTCLPREQLTFLLYRVLNNSLIAVAYQEYKQLNTFMSYFLLVYKVRALEGVHDAMKLYGQ